MNINDDNNHKVERWRDNDINEEEGGDFENDGDGWRDKEVRLNAIDLVNQVHSGSTDSETQIDPTHTYTYVNTVNWWYWNQLNF